LNHQPTHQTFFHSILYQMCIVESDSNEITPSKLLRNNIKVKFLSQCAQIHRWFSAYGIRGIPHAFVIGKDGKVAWHGHPMDPSFENELKKAAEASSLDPSKMTVDQLLEVPVKQLKDFLNSKGIDHSGKPLFVTYQMAEVMFRLCRKERARWSHQIKVLIVLYNTIIYFIRVQWSFSYYCYILMKRAWKVKLESCLVISVAPINIVSNPVNDG
jgi:hypothetical protein